MSFPHREVEADPYFIVINADREYVAGRMIPNGRYSARSVITRLDGRAVYKNFLMYQIDEGQLFDELEDALEDAESRARDAIANGFPAT